MLSVKKTLAKILTLMTSLVVVKTVTADTLSSDGYAAYFNASNLGVNPSKYEWFVGKQPNWNQKTHVQNSTANAIETRTWILNGTTNSTVSLGRNIYPTVTLVGILKVGGVLLNSILNALAPRRGVVGAC